MNNISDLDLLFCEACRDWDAGDLKSAFDKFLRASELGDPDSQNNLAVFFEQGLGIEVNLEKAIYWYEESTRNGSLIAPSNLADLYKKIGVYSEAVSWYERSIILGDGDSCLELGEMYYFGNGVNMDKSLAKEYFEKAIQSDNITPYSREKAEEYL